MVHIEGGRNIIIYSFGFVHCRQWPPWPRIIPYFGSFDLGRSDLELPDCGALPPSRGIAGRSRGLPLWIPDLQRHWLNQLDLGSRRPAPFVMRTILSNAGTPSRSTFNNLHSPNQGLDAWCEPVPVAFQSLIGELGPPIRVIRQLIPARVYWSRSIRAHNRSMTG